MLSSCCTTLSTASLGVRCHGFCQQRSSLSAAAAKAWHSPQCVQPCIKAMHSFTDHHLGIQLDFQFHHRHGIARCFRWHRWILLPHHCWLLLVLRWPYLLVLCRNCWPYTGGDCCGLWRPSVCVGQRGGDGYRRSQGQYPSRKVGPLDTFCCMSRGTHVSW